MIKVEFYYDPQNNINGFRVEGHAGFDESGKDIVCSAVSVLVLNTINSIEQFTDDGFSVDQNEDEGLIEFHIDEDEISETSTLLLKSLRLGLTDISESYGNEYVTIFEDIDL